MADVEILLNLFNQVCAGSSTEAIRAAEAKLAQLEKDTNFLAICGTILAEPQVKYAIKKLIAVYFEKFSKRMAKQKNTGKTVSTIQFYLKILLNHSIDFDLKPLVNVALEFLVNLEGNRAIKIDLASQLISQLKLSQGLADENINFSYLIFCGKAIFGAHNFNEDTRQFTKSSFKEYLNLNLKLLAMAQRYTLETKDSLFLIYKLLREYSALLKSFLKRLGVLDIDATKLLYLEELDHCLAKALSLNSKENSISNSIFILIPNEIELSRVINQAKCNYINSLASFTRLINTFVKHANLVHSNPLYMRLSQLLEYFIKSTSGLFEITPYYSIPTRSGILENIDQLFSLFVNCLRINDFYDVFGQNKTEIIEKILFPCISLTPMEAANFYEDPDEFRQFSFQIVERNLKTMAYMQEAKDEEEDPIKQYETLKTLASELLSSLCKFQDGTLTQVLQYALNVIENKINSVFSKTTMFLVIASLKDHLKERKDLKLKIAQLLMLLLEGLPIPVVQQNKRKEEDIEYAFLWLTLSKLLLSIKDLYPQIISLSFKVGILILQSASTNQVHKDFVLDMFDDLIRIDEGEKYIFDIVGIYNHLLSHTTELFSHLLDSYFDLIKYNSDILKKNPASILDGLRLVSRHIQKQVQKQDPVQMIINKCWNVIREVGQNSDFIPELIPSLEEIVLPLVPYIDGVRNLDFQEDILLLVTSFVEKGKTVTPNQQLMFEIIPKIFYGQYNCRFGQAFHTIQLFIYYGSDILKSSYKAIEAIVNMSITSITQSEYKKKPIGENQNCEGVLILQTLVSKCGDVFTLELWSSILKGIVSRLQRPVVFRFLSSNLYALLAMCLVHSHKFFSDQENQVLITRVLSNFNVFSNVEYSPKVLITALTELLLLYEVPFVNRRFVQILDLTISLLQFSSTKREGYFVQEEQESQQIEYSNSLILLKNDMKGLDEFNFFKRKIEQLKQMNRQLLVSSVAQFPQAKKEYLMNILTIEKVANVPRKIFKIKK